MARISENQPCWGPTFCPRPHPPSNEVQQLLCQHRLFPERAPCINTADGCLLCPASVSRDLMFKTAPAWRASLSTQLVLQLWSWRWTDDAQVCMAMGGGHAGTEGESDHRTRPTSNSNLGGLYDFPCQESLLNTPDRNPPSSTNWAFMSKNMMKG